ncbi:hypothetical protein [Polyangium sp. y55x31]|uniref:hypothetical protein n=1 Tax=Polyangium sp. y55x31 TaxID=3042688 RepID=UPI0024821501|nr:hypothetical protein [Polyangium sp. y55x31]MDI1479241.1 hypothetical protein [Polyangium sp. y55x31]
MPIKHLGVGVQTVHFQQPGGSFVYSSRASACYHELAPVDPTPSPPPCVLSIPDQTMEDPLAEPTGIVADAGPITVSGTLLGESILPPPTKPGETCFNEKHSTEPLSPGETVTFSAPGGADFLPFSFSMEAPAIPFITAAPLKPGEPLPIQWEGTGDGPITLLVVTMGVMQPVSLDCRVPDTGSFTVDAELTSAFAGAGGTPHVIAIRVKRTEEQDQPAVAARVGAWLGITSYLEVGYAP